MTITLGLVQGLLLLLPGIFFYLSFVGLVPGKGIRSEAPASGSLTVLTLVGVGAILAHIFGAMLISINALVVWKYGVKVDLPITPDPYSLLAKTGQPTQALIVFFTLSYTALLCCIAYLLGHLISKKMLSLSTKELQFGKFASLLEDTDPYEFLAVGYVVTNISRTYGAANRTQHVGYAGWVLDITHDETGVKSVLLTNATPFYLNKDASKLNVKTLHVSGGDTIEFLLIPESEIRTVSLEVLRVDGSPEYADIE